MPQVMRWERLFFPSTSYENPTETHTYAHTHVSYMMYKHSTNVYRKQIELHREWLIGSEFVWLVRFDFKSCKPWFYLFLSTVETSIKYEIEHKNVWKSKRHPRVTVFVLNLHQSGSRTNDWTFCTVCYVNFWYMSDFVCAWYHINVPEYVKIVNHHFSYHLSWRQERNDSFSPISSKNQAIDRRKVYRKPDMNFHRHHISPLSILWIFHIFLFVFFWYYIRFDTYTILKMKVA